MPGKETISHQKRRSVAGRLFVSAVKAGLVVGGIHAASMLTLDRRIQYKEIDYCSKRICPSLDGYTIAFITDTHALPMGELREVARRVSARRCGLLLLGGDFPDKEGAPAASMEVLGKVRTRDGIYGVCGNHDRLSILKKAMADNHAHLLDNEGMVIREGLYLAGIQDRKFDHPDVGRALGGAGEDDFILLLSHNPDSSMEPEAAKADLVLSGHTHGGQINVFGAWAPFMFLGGRRVSAYGQKFRTGWAKSDMGPDVFVSNGTGSHKGIPRVFARPQVIYLTLRSQR
ncbi:metallophosphoesterase family protein [Ruminococcaceae bacterium OttesenSCG-928-L11]|nr:metallophosphoesterase family protein [Ruminococcaceae bacterium OttesenSCG-928-L11]